MTAKKLAAASIGLPRFDIPATPGPREGTPDTVNLFQLSSHERARRALEFGLDVEAPGFNIFVLGEASSGRMSATMSYLQARVADTRPADDWLYLNNFRRTHKPRRVHLPAGSGRRFATAMVRTIPTLRSAVKQALEGRLSRYRNVAVFVGSYSCQ